MPGNFGETTFIFAFCCEAWMRNSAPSMAVYGSTAVSESLMR